MSLADELREIVARRYLSGTPLGDVLLGLAHLLDNPPKEEPHGREVQQDR